MISKYGATIEQIRTWAQSDTNIEGVIVIGSLAREQLQADQWSDLDLMVFVKDIHLLVDEHEWLENFGRPVCYYNSITPFHWVDWDWIVKRVLYSDNRDIDFSILRFDRMDEVLEVNRSIIAKGYEVIYDARKDVLTTKISALPGETAADEFKVPTEQELSRIINEILYHIIWAYKKIEREELWVGVSTINTVIKNLLLELVEVYNATVAKRTNFITFEGRFLEKRTPDAVLDKLRKSITRYDEYDAIDTLSHLIDITEFLAQAILSENDYMFNVDAFEGARKLYAELTESHIG